MSLKAAIVLAGVLSLGACASSPPPVVPTHVDFASDTVLNADVTSLDLQFGAGPPREYPHVGYRAPVPFKDAVKAWADERFNLTGNSVNTLRIALRQGDITEELLPVKTGLAGAFKKEQAAKYNANLEVSVEIVDPNGKVVTSTTAKGFNSHTVPEGATETDKRIVWAEMVKTAFDNLDQELIPQLRQGMSEYVR